MTTKDDENWNKLQGAVKGMTVAGKEGEVNAFLQDFVNLCAVGDIDENSEHTGWADLVKRAKALLEK